MLLQDLLVCMYLLLGRLTIHNTEQSECPTRSTSQPACLGSGKYGRQGLLACNVLLLLLTAHFFVTAGAAAEAAGARGAAK